MATRYRVEYREAGDVLDPRFWLDNQNEIAQEVNGYLDRDNLPAGAITEAMVNAEAFTRQTHDAQTTGFTPDPDTTTWQTTDAAGVTLGSASTTAAVDCLAILQWSGTWTWTGNWSGVIAGAPPSYVGREDAIRFRLMIDGTTVWESGWYGDSQKASAMFGVGAQFIAPGPHVFAVAVQVQNIYWHDLSFYSTLINSIVVHERELLVTLRKR